MAREIPRRRTRTPALAPLVMAGAGLWAGSLCGGPPAIAAEPVGETGERAREQPERPPGVAVPAGYRMRLLASGLERPSSVASSRDTVWVAERGEGDGSTRDGGTGTPARVREVEPTGDVVPVLSQADLPVGRLLPPLTAVVHQRGWLWIVHRQRGARGLAVGAVSRFRPADPIGTFATVITDLPSAGEHPTEDLVFDAAGRGYLAQGAATSAGVVGPESAEEGGWLPGAPTLRDLPPRPIVPSGAVVVTPNTLTPDPSDVAVTGGFAMFGSGVPPAGEPVAAPTPAEPVDGMIAGNGAVYSFAPSAADPASTLRLEAWGLRDPSGLALDASCRATLVVVNRGVAVRATGIGPDRVVLEARPVAGDRDDVHEVPVGGAVEFFGWPDAFHDPETGEPRPLPDALFCDRDAGPRGCPAPLLDEETRSGLRVGRALAQLWPPSASRKLAIATDGAFGAPGDVFIARHAPPVPGETATFTRDVVRVDRRTAAVTPFIARAPLEGGAPREPRLDAPVDVELSGGRMLIVDAGAPADEIDVLEPRPPSGKLWEVRRAE